MSAPLSATDLRTRRKTLLNLTLAVVGGVLLLITVRRVGWDQVQDSLANVGWWFVLVLALGGFRFVARARAWRLCIETMMWHAARGTRHQEPRTGHRAPEHPTAPGAPSAPVAPVAPVAPSIWHLFAAVLAGDALGNLTPLGLLASEPAKVYFVNDRLPTTTAVSSVAAENAFYVASVFVMIGAGALVFFEVAELSDTLQPAAQAVLALVMVGGLAALWIARRQPAIVSRIAGAVATWTGRGVTAPDRLREIEVHFYAVLTWPAARILRVLGWEAVFHVAAVAEVFIVLWLLSAGRETTFADAFVLETAGRLIVVAFKFVPYRLGVDEAGTALVAGALAVDPAAGVTLALIRRIRILCWNAIGLALLGRLR